MQSAKRPPPTATTRFQRRLSRQRAFEARALVGLCEVVPDARARRLSSPATPPSARLGWLAGGAARACH